MVCGALCAVFNRSLHQFKLDGEEKGGLPLDFETEGEAAPTDLSELSAFIHQENQGTEVIHARGGEEKLPPGDHQDSGGWTPDAPCV